MTTARSDTRTTAVAFEGRRRRWTRTSRDSNQEKRPAAGTNGATTTTSASAARNPPASPQSQPPLTPPPAPRPSPSSRTPVQHPRTASLSVPRSQSPAIAPSSRSASVNHRVPSLTTPAARGVLAASRGNAPPPPSPSTDASSIYPPPNVIPTMSAVRRLLTGANQSDAASSKNRQQKALNKIQHQHQPVTAAQPCPKCAASGRAPYDVERQVVLLRELSIRSAPDRATDRLEACCKGDYHAFIRLFRTACDVQPIIGAAVNRQSSMSHLQADKLKIMGVTLAGTDLDVTMVTNGAGILFVLKRDNLVTILYEGLHVDIAYGEETNIDVVLKTLIELTVDADIDDLNALLSSFKFGDERPPADAIDELNSGGLHFEGLKFTRSEFYTTRVLCMMTKTDVYEQGFYRKYVHIDRVGTSYTSTREGETSTLTKLNVMPDAVNSPVESSGDLLGEDLFMTRRKGRKDKFRLTCSVSVNVWEEYETPEWFGYIHPPPNADAVRPADLRQLKSRLEAYGVPDGADVCRMVYHCLGHKSRNCNVKVDTISTVRSYFMYLKNFLKHGTTGAGVHHILEGDEMAVVYDGIAYRVAAPQTEMRHRSLFMSLVISDERERNGKNVAKRSVIRRMCSTSEVVLSLCREITYLNAEYDEEGGTLYSASAEEENLSEAWATCMALFACDGYGCLEGCFNCAIENRRGAIVDESAVFMNDVQVPVVFDKLYRKTSIAEELSTMSDARGATYPGAFISGRDQCNERTYLAGRRHAFSRASLSSILMAEWRLAADVFQQNQRGSFARLTYK